MKVPNVEPFAIEALQAEGGWSEDRKLSGHSVVVDVGQRTAEIQDAHGRALAFFPITPGEPKFVPLGEWKIEVMTAFPRFRWDKQMLEAGARSRDALMLPPGPNSPVGVVWAGLNRSGIGLARDRDARNHRSQPQSRVHPVCQLGCGAAAAAGATRRARGDTY